MPSITDYFCGPSHRGYERARSDEDGGNDQDVGCLSVICDWIIELPENPNSSSFEMASLGSDTNEDANRGTYSPPISLVSLQPQQGTETNGLLDGSLVSEPVEERVNSECGSSENEPEASIVTAKKVGESNTKELDEEVPCSKSQPLTLFQKLETAFSKGALLSFDVPPSMNARLYEVRDLRLNTAFSKTSGHESIVFSVESPADVIAVKTVKLSLKVINDGQMTRCTGDLEMQHCQPGNVVFTQLSSVKTTVYQQDQGVDRVCLDFESKDRGTVSNFFHVFDPVYPAGELKPLVEGSD